jgi:hypothetical protein
MAEFVPPEDLSNPELEPYAHAVGTLCNEWSKLELNIRLLFMVAAKMPSGNASVGACLCLDVKDLIEAIKVLVTFAKFTEEESEKIFSTFSYVNEKLRTLRNRYVHDVWHPSIQGFDVSRFTYVAK